MSEYKPDEYIPTIDAILSVSDLDKVSVKKIRRALQELFVIDLEPHKETINEVILTRYHKLSDERENNQQSELERRKEIERKDALLARQLLKEHGYGLRRKTITEKNTKAPRKRKVKDPNAPSKPKAQIMFMVSDILKDIINVEVSSRPQVVKLLWVYIKENKLQDPSDGRVINCDETLERLFKKKTVTAFLMNKYLSDHLTRADQSVMVSTGKTKGEVDSKDDEVPQPTQSDDVGLPDDFNESESEEE